MGTPFEIGDMTVAEKLRMMEAIWDDLCQRAEQLESPHWHGDVLKEREEARQDGRQLPQDWDSAKEAIRKRLS